VGIECSAQYDDLGTLETALSGLDIERVCAGAAPEIERLITEQFWAGTDPFGATWAPLARGGASHLIDTGALLSSIHLTGQPDGLGFEMDHYGGYHQTGTPRMPARPVLPLGGDYPNSWDAEIGAVVERLLGGL
jgi:hypothetical protein